MTEPWCVLLAGRESPQRPAIGASGAAGARAQVALRKRDPLAATLGRANTVASLDRIAAVIGDSAEIWQQGSFKDLEGQNLIVQPKDRGTGHEVLLALLLLERRIPADAPVIFLPTDHIVGDEGVMSTSLLTMVKWIVDEPTSVYLLGAVPRGPHDQLGYILPWYDAMLVPTGVYEFVERPDVQRARKLINAGGLWNTFIFGATVASLIKLFAPRFGAAIDTLRRAIQSRRAAAELERAYDRLKAVDFSRDVLAEQTDTLKVLRLLRCGWWPIKPPTLNPPAHEGSVARLDPNGAAGERRRLG
jgi:mannose-1-phosphate guanylyltransferase